MKPLDRLRWKLTAWYVATFGAILIAFSVGLFFTISRSSAAKMDRSLAHAAGLVRETVIAENGIAFTPRALKIPDRALYLFDADGRLIAPDTASQIVRSVARNTMATGETSRQFDVGHEHTLLVHAVRFMSGDGRPLVAVAAADTEELEDEYARLITVVSVALGLALVAVAFGGYALAQRSSVPVEEAFERMRRFTADAAHELRTPIAFLRAQSELSLERERSGDEYVAALREVSAEAARVGTIVDDLFMLARADAGERRIEREVTYLDDIVVDVVTAARALATTRGVAVDIAEFEEARVVADPRMLSQLARIVVENAIKYTRSGGRVSVSVSARDHRALLIVEDTGIGIDSGDVPRIFDRFYRTSNARSAADGAGLGLSIAQWIVNAHHGQIDVTSTPGLGTRISMSIPVGEGAARDSSSITETVRSHVTVA